MINSKKVFLVGSPNSGKTTLFNWITGYKNRTVNYPGSTVSVSIGRIQKKYDCDVSIMDTPGVYSLFPQSEDEKITCKSIFEDKKDNCVVAVIDASKIEKQCSIIHQLKDSGFNVIVALTMSELFKIENKTLDKFQEAFKVPFVKIKGLTGEGVSDLIEEIKKQTQQESAVTKVIADWNLLKRESVRNLYKSLFENLKNLKAFNFFLSRKWDRFLLHPKWGFVFFVLIMFVLFSSLFWLADPFMGMVDDSFAFAIEKVQSISSESLVVDLVANGILGSFGAVLVFVPQIFILFFGISFLEDSGYLSRAVSLVDGPLSKIGLSGRSFIPFLSGYACSIPAALSARSIPSPREKWMTLFTIPFMSCSARLPVYALLLSFLFYGESAFKPGLVLTIIYFGAFLIGVLTVSILNLFLKKDREIPFAIDLPLYRRPLLLTLLKTSWNRTKHYITRAGPAIFTFALLIWVAVSFPRNLEISDSEQIQQSYASMVGQFIEPAFEWMGVDWRVGVALLAAFVAREVFVSSLVLVFSITATNEDSVTSSLIQKMGEVVNSEGEPMFTVASVTALIVLFMFSLQCLSTTAVMYKETQSKMFAFVQFAVLNLVAYALAVITYQALNLF